VAWLVSIVVQTHFLSYVLQAKKHWMSCTALVVSNYITLHHVVNVLPCFIIGHYV